MIPTNEEAAYGQQFSPRHMSDGQRAPHRIGRIWRVSCNAGGNHWTGSSQCLNLCARYHICDADSRVDVCRRVYDEPLGIWTVPHGVARMHERG